MPKLRVRKVAAKVSVPNGPNGLVEVTPEAEGELLRRLAKFTAQFRGVAEVEKVLPSALRLGMDFFRVSEGCVTVVAAGSKTAEILLASSGQSSWDADFFAAFLRGEKVQVPPELMLARLRRYGRMWGALAIRAPGVDFRWDARQAFSSIGSVVTQMIQQIDEGRIREVRARIDQKIIEQIEPKDLSYQILHGIRSLIGYNHSAALLTCDPDRTQLEIVGEQIAWRKAKSQKVGQKLLLPPAALELLGRNTVYGFNRQGRHWHDWTESQATALATLLDYNCDGLDPAVSTAEGAVLCAPLATRHGVLGVLKVAAVQPDFFGPYEVEIISQFLPQAAVALQNMRRTESLEMRMRAAERKQAMADLARGVAHDVNNALGSVLPLVQQLREDLKAGPLDPQLAADDLREIERSVQVCRRIFRGMLEFARSAASHSSEVFLHLAIESTLAIFQQGLRRQDIELAVDVPQDLPPLRGSRSDIDQLLFNLIGNARDSMASGGRLTIRARQEERRVELEIIDTGCGIAPEELLRIQEPFFTTKSSGYGLGLAICRSIVSQMHGKLHIESEAGRGTCVRISFPLPEEPTT